MGVATKCYEYHTIGGAKIYEGAQNYTGQPNNRGIPCNRFGYMGPTDLPPPLKVNSDRFCCNHFLLKTLLFCLLFFRDEDTAELCLEDREA